eukprot:TRINITY_DN82618_c0_g1_i3.p1 TRINITY_DN82618_c0_g1~~TRINITY_DN82618_c0_g1_i3.p1  ORF type:complete len:151 (-),score=10.08 TRINITY_DN82618_c0_g1_i3:625-1077(-)
MLTKIDFFLLFILPSIVLTSTEVPPGEFYIKQHLGLYGGVFDIRSQTQYNCVHINDTISLPYVALFDMMSAGFYHNLRKQLVGIISKEGNEAKLAAAMLENIFKFTDVETLQGGMDNYLSKDLPIVDGPGFPYCMHIFTSTLELPITFDQ